jgi:hypothetical protein
MKRESALYTLVAAVVLAYVTVRAVTVPVIHDEARTYQMFVATGEFLPFRAAWDAGNHILVTALATVSQAIAGPDLFLLRIWSVLGFLLYSWYAWCLGRHVASSLVRWCLWSALLCTPFVLDFFSLFRGYGPAMGLLLMAVHHLTAFGATRGTGDLIAAMTAITLAAFGSLSMLLLWCAAWTGCLALAFLCPVASPQRVKQWLVLAAALLPLGFAAWYSSAMSRADALYFGSVEGLFSGTLLSLLKVVLGTTSKAIAGVVIAILLAIAAVAVLQVREGSFQQVGLLRVCIVLVAADLAGRVILDAGFGVLYPIDRTAMHLVPLFLLAAAMALDRVVPRHPAFRHGALVLLVLPARMIATANLDRTVYWSEQSIPAEFYRIAVERQRVLGRPLLIGAYHQMPYCWRFMNHANGLGLNELDPTDFPQPNDDLLMIDTTFRTPPAGFRTIARAATGHNNLLERMDPLRTRALSDTVFPPSTTDAEFVVIWEPHPGAFAGKEAIIEWSARLTSDRAVEVALVLEVSDARGDHLMYRKVEITATPSGSRAWMGLRLPAITPAAGRVVCYLYNPRNRTFALDDHRVRIHGIVG